MNCLLVLNVTLGVAGFGGGGFLSDLYMIDPRSLVTKDLSVLVTGAAPSARMRLAYAFLNGRVYIHGGRDATGLLNDLRGFAIQQEITVPSVASLSFFLQVYDWDVLLAGSDQDIIFQQHIALCVGSLPCSIFIKGAGGNKIILENDGSLSCQSTLGCTALTLDSVRVVCAHIGARTLRTAFDILGSNLVVSNSSFESCSSGDDGGTFKTYQAATVVIEHSSFRNSRSEKLGGAVALVGVQANLTNVTFTNCSSATGGGAVSVSGFALYGSLQSFYARVHFSSCAFESCKTENDGGAIVSSSSSAAVVIEKSMFSECFANETGGAVSATDSVEMTIRSTVFEHNTANGIGGGALYSGNASIMISDSYCSYNQAVFGGGGAILWSGDDEPKLLPFPSSNGLNITETSWKTICTQNAAAYGPCVASTYKWLQVASAPNRTHRAFPGLAFPFSVLKVDAYNQTIVTDSSSTIQIFSTIGKSSIPTVSILGATVALLSEGQADFLLAVKPDFFEVEPCFDSELFTTKPGVFAQGVDSITDIVMRTNDQDIPMSNCSMICPPGYILQLDRPGSAGRAGSCVLCAAGTYSLDPLAGTSENPRTPVCLKCPAGGDCVEGGSAVSFESGNWTVSDGMYILLDCPLGYQLINSTTYTSYGIFSHDEQQCKACKQNEYITDQLQSCQTCPTGAKCDAGQLTGSAGSYWRREGDRLRVYKCDPGFIMVRDDSENGRMAFLDACVECQPSTYSLVGARIVSSDHCVWTGETDQPYKCQDTNLLRIVAFDDETSFGAWTSSPALALQLCISCPVGADCPGGSSVIPQLGFWRDQILTGNVSRRTLENLSIVATILQCPPGACLQNGTCVDGRTGPICGICEDGWAMASNKCLQCPTDKQAYDAEKIAIAVGGSIAVLAILFVFSLKPLFEQDDSSNATPNEDQDSDSDSGDDGDFPSVSAPKVDFQTLFNELKNKLVSSARHSEVMTFLQGYCKVIIGFFQVLSTFADNFKVNWPSSVSDLFSKAAVLRFDLLSLPGPNCLAAELNYQTKLLIYTITPIAVIILICLAPFTSLCLGLKTLNRAKDEKIKTQFWNNLMFFLFLIYPTLSVAIFSSFNCQVVGHYGSLLMADYREPCPLVSGAVITNNFFVLWWSLLFTIVYVAGIPLFFLVMMNYYKIPAIAAAKIRKAKVQALISVYKNQAIPLEVDILIRQLNLGLVVQNDVLLQEQINELFDSMAEGSEVITKCEILKFLRKPDLGLPDPEGQNLEELFKSKEGKAKSKLSRRAFAGIMTQAVYIHDLFTGHETLDDMDADRLFRLYEFHANNRIYVWACDQDDCSRKKKDKLFTKFTLVYEECRNRIGVYFSHIPGEKQDEQAANEEKNQAAPSGKELEPTIGAEVKHDVHCPGEVSEEKNLECEEKSENTKILELRAKLLEVADSKVLAGSIVLPSIPWNMVDNIRDSGVKDSEAQPNQIQEEETLAIQRMGFLIKNYDARLWYFEIIDMMRKLMMTSVVVFIYPGSSAQIAAALVISILSALYVQHAQPFLDHRIGNTQAFSLMAHSLTLVYAIMLIFQDIYSDMLHLSLPFVQEMLTQALAGCVIAINLGTVVFPYFSMALSLILVCLTGNKKVNKTAENDVAGVHQQNPCSSEPSGDKSRKTFSFVRDAKKWKTRVASKESKMTKGTSQPCLELFPLGNETFPSDDSPCPPSVPPKPEKPLQPALLQVRELGGWMPWLQSPLFGAQVSAGGNGLDGQRPALGDALGGALSALGFLGRRQGEELGSCSGYCNDKGENRGGLSSEESAAVVATAMVAKIRRSRIKAPYLKTWLREQETCCNALFSALPMPIA